ncbi:MAG: hypothetical protein MHM6MM_004190 [Cercozoa sp. M6MM]
MACAIAYKRDKFTHTWEDHRSRSLLLQLRFHRQEVEQEENVPACEEHVQNTEASAEHLENTVGTPEPLQEHESHQKRNKKKQRKKKRKVDPPRHPEDHLIVACCHLEGTPNAVAARVSQMHKSLHRIRLQQSEMGMTVESAPVIIAGDFNCAGRSAVAELLETGNLEPSFREHHYTVEPCKKEISHELELRDAWDGVRAEPTYCQHFYSGKIDFIYHSPATLRRSALLYVHESPEAERLAMTRFLPTAEHVSDHMPLSAEFERATYTE